MNIARFVVLGTLDRLGTASGYDIIRDLDRKMISRWTHVKKGSIYHALKALHKEQLIRVTRRVKQGLYPTMTVYEITDQGREAFDAMQAEAFLGLYPYYFGFKLALKFNVRRSAAQIADFGKKACAAIDNVFAGMDAYLNTLADGDAQKESDTFFIEHDKMLLRAEKQWIKMAVKRAGGG